MAGVFYNINATHNFMDCIYERYPEKICRVIGCKNKALKLIINDSDGICRVCEDHFYTKANYMKFPYIYWSHCARVYDIDLLKLHPADMINHLSFFLCCHLTLYYDVIVKGKINTVKKIVKNDTHADIKTTESQLADINDTIVEEAKKEAKAAAIKKINDANFYSIKFFGGNIKTIYKHIKLLNHYNHLPWYKFGITWFIVFDKLFYLDYNQSLYNMIQSIYDGLHYKNISIKKIVSV